MSASNNRHRSCSVAASVTANTPHMSLEDDYSYDSNTIHSPLHLSSSAPSIGTFFTSHSPSSSGSHSRNSSVPPPTTPPTFSIEFDGGSQTIIRPNRIIRGKVLLNISEKIHLTRIRIKFRAEESAMVKVEEGGSDGKGDWIHSVLTTYFETEWKLFGQEISPYSQSGWDEIEPGYHEYPFALKFPNVNYPPSTEEPAGFSIRYIWSAHADGPGLQTGIKSRDFITPYRPIIVSMADKEWVYKTTLMSEKKHALAEVQAKIDKQTYCPDEAFTMQLNMIILNSDSKIVNILYKFRKHHEGKMLVQQGTAFRESIRIIHQDTLLLNSSDPTQLSENVSFSIPTRLVSPSFISRHTRVYYDLFFQVTIEHGHLFRSNHVIDFTIPVSIANLPSEQLLLISDLRSIHHYKDSIECPLFFDPLLDEPPAPHGLPSELIGPLTAALMGSTQPEEQPPSYFSIPELPPQFELRKERKERTVFLNRQAKGAYHSVDLPEATVIPGLFDEDW